jgi:hypothetical protein
VLIAAEPLPKPVGEPARTTGGELTDGDGLSGNRRLERCEAARRTLLRSISVIEQTQILLLFPG